MRGGSREEAAPKSLDKKGEYRMKEGERGKIPLKMKPLTQNSKTNEEK